MFLFYCFHIFGFGFKSFFLDWLYFFFDFGFWLSVRMVYILYFVLFFYIFYFILATRLASPLFYSVFPFLFGPFFIRSPPFIQSLKTNLFLFVIHSLLLLLTASFKSSSLVVVRRLFVPAKCVRIKKLCKTHYKCHYTTMIYIRTCFFIRLIIPPVIPRKKNNYFLSTSHLVYPFQKSVVLC
jgi:hypothetical protein